MLSLNQYCYCSFQRSAACTTESVSISLTDSSSEELYLECSNIVKLNKYWIVRERERERLQCTGPD